MNENCFSDLSKFYNQYVYFNLLKRIIFVKRFQKSFKINFNSIWLNLYFSSIIQIYADTVLILAKLKFQTDE